MASICNCGFSVGVRTKNTAATPNPTSIWTRMKATTTSTDQFNYLNHVAILFKYTQITGFASFLKFQRQTFTALTSSLSVMNVKDASINKTAVITSCRTNTIIYFRWLDQVNKQLLSSGLICTVHDGLTHLGQAGMSCPVRKLFDDARNGVNIRKSCLSESSWMMEVLMPCSGSWTRRRLCKMLTNKKSTQHPPHPTTTTKTSRHDTRGTTRS